MKEEKEKKKLKIDICELESAFDQQGFLSDGFDDFDEFPTSTFLNLTTGEITFPKTWDEHEEILDDSNSLELPEDLRDYGSPQTRLEDFVKSLENDSLRKALARIRRGKGMFRKYKRVILESGDVAAKRSWYWFETVRQREVIVQWLEGANIEPVWGCDIFEPITYPDKRVDLLRAVLRFVRDVRKSNGVRQIALLGSLATDKPTPKDVDLLVKITHGTDLKTVARRSRQLTGRTIQTGDSCGADVFLCSPELEYLGRVCGFKECAPGLRASCQARHCGRREFLNDDLDSVTLNREIMAKPPLILWPQVVVNGELPADVVTELVAPLQQDY